MTAPSLAPSAVTPLIGTLLDVMPEEKVYLLDRFAPDERKRIGWGKCL